MADKIKSIIIPNTARYAVGCKHGNDNEITEIVNHSQEFQDHSEYHYQVLSDNKTIADIINCPVIVEYEIN